MTAVEETGALMVPPRRFRVAIAVLGSALTVATGLLVTSWSTSEYDWIEGLGRAVIVGTPIAVGLYAYGRPPFRRFGGQLIGLGAAWFVVTLANSPDDLLYSTGRVAGWLSEVVLVYLLLAFPTGRLTSRADRVIVGVVAADVLLLYVPTALLVDAYPLPTWFTGCASGCPGNAYDVAGGTPAFVEDVVYPLREVVIISAAIAATVSLGLRLRDASPVMRRTLEPVLVVAILRVAALGVTVLVRRLDLFPDRLSAVAWLVALALPALAIAFLLGLVRWRLFVAHAMQRLATELPGHAEPEQLRAALADAFDDPSIEIVYWLDGDRAGWVDVHGAPYEPPAADSGRCLSEVRDNGTPVAAIVHDEGLRDDAFVATATSYALMTMDNQRLSAQARALLREVSDSRARIQATADDERRRIERDLHDGAQQRLVALRIKLELVAEQTGVSDPAGAATLRQLGTEVEDAIDEMRSLARGIYPAVLADRGLVEALRSVALQSPLPATVLAAGVGRYSREIETTAYFCCLEALQNAAKHAAGATAVVIDVGDDGTLRLEVRDDGAGFDPGPAAGGAGFVNMRDRLSAVAGELTVDSSPGKGTRVLITIPLNRA